MVLTFSDWSHYVDEAGNPRTIDWDNLPGYPRAAVAEALRQALLERAAPLADMPTFWATRDGVFAGSAQLAEPIRIGVDLDAVRKLEAMEQLLEALAAYYITPDAGSISMSCFPSWTDHLQRWDPDTREIPTVWGMADYVRYDVLSAAWAREMRRVLLLCTTTLSIVASFAEGVASLVPYSPETWHPGGVRDPVGSLTSEAVSLVYSHATWADYAAAFAALEWSPAATPDNPYYWWYAAGSGRGRRARRRLDLAASLKARAVSVYLYYHTGWPPADGTFPEGQPDPGWNLDATLEATAEPMTYTARDSTALPADRPWGSWSAHADFEFGSIRSDWAVPGGFTFRETAP